MSRIERLAACLELPLLVTSLTNVRYLTGFVSSNAVVLVEPDGDATAFADFRYAEAGRALQGVAFEQTGRFLLAEVAEKLAGRTVGFERVHLSYASWETLSEKVDAVPTSGLVEALRAVKEPAEQDAIEAAAGLSDHVYAELAGQRFTGRTERELAWWVERRFRELGAEGIAFTPIVVAGENGAHPHRAPSDHVIEAGTLVTVDAGCVVDGYRSDCTRTFATGPLPDELAHAYDVCLRAQIDSLHAVRPGAVAGDVDAVARDLIAAAGLGERFGHGLGHAVGLDIHEAPPTLREGSTDVLEAGNVVTVEPGIYLPGVGGVRIEDLVLVTEDGHRRLTTVAKDLVVVE